MDIRVGHGIDIHPFVEGRRCVLGGVDIPHSKGLQGHSDADALVHALIDALLGACGESDIGTFFPDSDPAYAGIDSCVLLRRVCDGIAQKGFRVGNADLVVLAQEPKLAPHIALMKEKLSNVIGIDVSRISIKATTTEHLGFVGRREGVLASAVVLIHGPG